MRSRKSDLCIRIPAEIIAWMERRAPARESAATTNSGMTFRFPKTWDRGCRSGVEANASE